MTADIELLPLPEADDSVENHAQWPIVIDSDVWLQKSVQDYARANVAHHTAKLQAEIEALRAEVERLQRQLRQTHKDYGCELRDPNGTIWEYAAAQKARAERLAEALQWYAEQAEGCRKIGSIGEPFRKELDRDGGKRARAALRDHDQEGK